MSPLLDADNYVLRLVGLPFLVAASALGAVFVYALVMRGAPRFRIPILLFTGAMLPYVVAFGLAVAAPTDAAAAAFFRLGTAFVPLASTAAMVFELALADRLRAYRPVVVVSAVVSAGFLVLGLATAAAVDHVIVTPSGLRFFAAGPLVPPAVAVITLASVAAFVEALRAARAATVPARRRQLWGGLTALACSFLGMVDIGLAYGVGYAPVSWVFVTLGALLALRSIFQDDLLRTRSLDSRAPVAFLGWSLGGVGAWLVAAVVVDGWPWWVVALALALVGLGARLAVALVSRGWSIRLPGEGPLDRLLAQYAIRVREVGAVDAVGQLTAEVCQVGLGDQVRLIVPAADDWSWRWADGVPLPEAQTPDPLLGPWLADRRRPLALADLAEPDLADLRASATALLAAFPADAVVPLVSHDELVGLLVVVRGGRRGPRPVELAFLEAIAARAAAALDYVRIAAEVETRAALVRDVALAATVQAGFVPGPEPSSHQHITVVGSWQPASECGGDWWSRYALADGQTLIVIGDVTGSGVAAAMVTAATRGACDAVVAAATGPVDLSQLLEQLDRAVRQVGAGRFHLTCFVALLDPSARAVHFANAGHVSPYVCRPRAAPGGDPIELSALVARGNPLGAGAEVVAKVATRPLLPGDVVVWYTDGLVECHGADGKQFGDRRLQRVLKRLADDERDPVAVQRRLAGELAAHLGGLPIGDDMTLVVARFDPGAAA
ncbi:MAG: SpoIIE family protein phosphatase [Kofleriaceae bacterium]